MKRRHPASQPAATGGLEGLVIGSFGRHVLVEDAQGNQRICHPKGKRNEAVVGDRILWQASEDEGRIIEVVPRKNLLFRQDEMRTKSFAANLDHVCLFLGATPEFSERQLGRALVACEAANIKPTIVLNKADLQIEFARNWTRLETYRAMGYTTLALSLATGQEQGLAELEALMRDRVTLVLGPSGAGKSSLINRLLPNVRAHTQEISQALNSGKHTTTSTTWYWLDALKQGAVIDSPGFQEFGLHHIEAMHLANLMPDIATHLGHCKYYNCTHRSEPECQVREAVHDKLGETKAIVPTRYQMYLDWFEELSQPPKY
jgi:ribosome biogenesis GTPase